MIELKFHKMKFYLAWSAFASLGHIFWIIFIILFINNNNTKPLRFLVKFFNTNSVFMDSMRKVKQTFINSILRINNVKSSKISYLREHSKLKCQDSAHLFHSQSFFFFFYITTILYIFEKDVNLVLIIKIGFEF